jgi:hypothetical protein
LSPPASISSTDRLGELTDLQLIDRTGDNMPMFGLIFLSLIVALAPHAYIAGADSRIDEIARRRRFNG